MQYRPCPARKGCCWLTGKENKHVMVQCQITYIEQIPSQRSLTLEQNKQNLFKHKNLLSYNGIQVVFFGHVVFPENVAVMCTTRNFYSKTNRTLYA